MKLISRVVFLIVALTCIAEASETQLSRYVHCLEALRKISFHYRDEIPGVSNFVIIPGVRFQKKGFYLFSYDAAHFVEFPAKPDGVDSPNLDSGCAYYSFNIKLSGKKTFPLGYADCRGFHAFAESFPDSTSSFPVFRGNDVIGPDTYQILAEELLNRVSTVSDYFQQLGFRNIDNTKKNLEVCQAVDDPKIKSAIFKQLGALKAVTPNFERIKEGSKHDLVK